MRQFVVIGDRASTHHTFLYDDKTNPAPNGVLN